MRNFNLLLSCCFFSSLVVYGEENPKEVDITIVNEQVWAPMTEEEQVMELLGGQSPSPFFEEEGLMSLEGSSQDQGNEEAYVAQLLERSFPENEDQQEEETSLLPAEEEENHTTTEIPAPEQQIDQNYLEHLFEQPVPEGEKNRDESLSKGIEIQSQEASPEDLTPPTVIIGDLSVEEDHPSQEGVSLTIISPEKLLNPPQYEERSTTFKQFAEDLKEADNYNVAIIDHQNSYKNASFNTFDSSFIPLAPFDRGAQTLRQAAEVIHFNVPSTQVALFLQNDRGQWIPIPHDSYGTPSANYRYA